VPVRRSNPLLMLGTVFSSFLLFQITLLLAMTLIFAHINWVLPVHPM
jgi:hypothetical protein